MFSMVHTGGPNDTYDIDTSDDPFGHLLNFFQTDQAVGQTSQLFRIFEYTHVPSRFVTTNFELDPATFSGGTQFTDARYLFPSSVQPDLEVSRSWSDQHQYNSYAPNLECRAGQPSGSEFRRDCG